MSRTILFGASGFVGKALVALLTQHKVEHVALSSKACDLTSPDCIAQIAESAEDGDSIVLLSALTPEKGKADELTIRNILMIRNLLTGLQGKNIAQFIYISSDAVFPLSADRIDENTPTTAGSMYGQMHVMREQFARDYVAPEKLTILRPCAIYGEHDTHNAYGVMRFLRSAREKGTIDLFGNGEEYRDHIHVEDLAAIIADALARRVCGTFNIASGTSWRFVEIAEFIKANLGKPVTLNFKPRALGIQHRHVNMAKTWSAFPAHQPRRIETGLKALLGMAV